MADDTQDQDRSPDIERDASRSARADGSAALDAIARQGTKTQARKVVLVSMAALTIVNVYRARQGNGSLFRRLWGTGVLGVMLSLLADFAPTIAGPFSVLVVLGAWTNGGDQALQGLLDRIGPAGASLGVGVAPASTAGGLVQAAGNPSPTMVGSVGGAALPTSPFTGNPVLP